MTDRPARILLADDLPLFRQAIAQLIDTQADLEVVGQAPNGLLAVEAAIELRPDVVVLDVEMPVMNGIEAARRLRVELPDVRIVMLTVSDDDVHLLDAVRLGVHGYLLKDLAPAELFDMIRSALRNENPVSPALVGRLLSAIRAGDARGTRRGRRWPRRVQSCRSASSTCSASSPTDCRTRRSASGCPSPRAP